MPVIWGTFENVPKVWGLLKPLFNISHPGFSKVVELLVSFSLKSTRNMRTDLPLAAWITAYDSLRLKADKLKRYGEFHMAKMGRINRVFSATIPDQNTVTHRKACLPAYWRWPDSLWTATLSLDTLSRTLYHAATLPWGHFITWTLYHADTLSRGHLRTRTLYHRTTRSG